MWGTARRRAIGYGALGSVVLLAMGAMRTAAVADGSAALDRVSVASDGASGNDRSLLPAVNADGTIVAFKSSASNLAPGDTNEKVDVFVRDRNSGVTERVTMATAGNEPNDNSFPPALDAAGRNVGFASLANNLVRGDFNLGADVFVYDRPRHTTEIDTLVVDFFGEGRGGGGAVDLPPSLSADGSVVAFTSTAEDLVANDVNQTSDVFARDRAHGLTELVSVATIGSHQGRSGNGASGGGVLSADGCIVAFYSDAADLVPGDTNEARDVFVRDRCAGTTERVSVSSGGEQADGPSQAAGFQPAISADGRYVAFSSDATNLAAGDINGVSDIFVYDRSTRTTVCVSKSAAGADADGPSWFPALSGDGHFVAFQSQASNLVPDDQNGKADVFVVDIQTGAVQRLSISVNGGDANGDSGAPQISRDGVTVVFQSDASNLVSDDRNGVTDIFAGVNELSFTPTPTPITPAPTPTASATPSSPAASATPTHANPSPTPIPSTPTQDLQTRTPTGRSATPTVGEGTPTQTHIAHTATATAVSGTATPNGQTMTAAARTQTPIGQTMTAAAGTQTPNAQTMTAAARTQTPNATVPTGTATAISGGNSDGGGCSCRIDPQTHTVADATPLQAVAPPLLFWLWRRARRAARSHG